MFVDVQKSAYHARLRYSIDKHVERMDSSEGIPDAVPAVIVLKEVGERVSKYL